MAFELNKLVDKLKPHGIELGEEAAKVVVAAVTEWVSEGVSETEGKIDDALVLPLIAILKPIVDKAVDGIDGKVG